MQAKLFLLLFFLSKLCCYAPGGGGVAWRKHGQLMFCFGTSRVVLSLVVFSVSDVITAIFTIHIVPHTLGYPGTIYIYSGYPGIINSTAPGYYMLWGSRVPNLFFSHTGVDTQASRVATLESTPHTCTYYILLVYQVYTWQVFLLLVSAARRAVGTRGK